jgi:hypothetical protein
MFWKLAVFFPANCGYPHQELHNFGFFLQCQVSEMNFTFLFQSFHQKALGEHGKRGLRLINFHPRKVLKQQKDIFDFYEKQSMPLLPNLECCNISFALEAEVKNIFLLL